METPRRITVERHEGVAVISFNRPEVLNCLDQLLARETTEAIGTLAGRDDVGALVLTGAGRAFCAGADLAVFHGWAQADPATLGDKIAEVMEVDLNPLIEAILGCPVPVLAAVNGPAVGGGAGIALAADVVLAGRSAYFLFPQATRLGLVPDLGATWLAQRLAGRARALGAMLLGDAIPAETAERWGLIWKCVDDAALSTEALAAAARLTRVPRSVARATRALVDAAAGGSAAGGGAAAQLDAEMRAQREVGKAPVVRDAVAAFVGTARAGVKTKPR